MIPDPYKTPTERFRREIGILIKNARGKTCSQENLAKSIGLTRTSVNNIEHGRQRVMVDTLLMISDILKIPIVDLLPSSFEISPTLDTQIPQGTSDSVKEWVHEMKNSE